MSTVTASCDTTVKHAPSRLTRTLPRATTSAGALAAAATTAGAAVLRADARSWPSARSRLHGCSE